MASKYNVYSAHFKEDSNGYNLVVLSQTPQRNGYQNVLEIPIDDIQDIISVLRNARNQADKLATVIDQTITIIDPDLLKVMINLFLSGNSISQLVDQFNMPYETIKYNLEKKGIIVFDDV
ncbi:hypothetical protein [Flavobacterium sp.]|uniref:hypothetical protein n=1 Tax=Flavobacterium sp. TaxID=239 RepID=UPI002FD9C957